MLGYLPAVQRGPRDVVRRRRDPPAAPRSGRSFASRCARYQPDSVPAATSRRQCSATTSSSLPERTTRREPHRRAARPGCHERPHRNPRARFRRRRDYDRGGPDRHRQLRRGLRVRMHRVVVARLQRRDPAIPTDLGWETVATEELPVRGFGRNVYEAAWVGELEAPRTSSWRAPRRERRLAGHGRGVGAPERRPRGSRRCPLAPRLGAAADLRRRDRALVTAARKNRRWSSGSVDAESDGGRHGGTRPGRTSGTCDFFLTRSARDDPTNNAKPKRRPQVSHPLGIVRERGLVHGGRRWAAAREPPRARARDA